MCVGPNRPEPAPTRATGLDMISAARLDLRFDRPARLDMQGAMVEQVPLQGVQVEESLLEDSAATGIPEESPPEESPLKDNHRAALPEKSPLKDRAATGIPADVESMYEAKFGPLVDKYCDT